MKKYYFMAGLMRSGNTLISSILNQNPDIKVTPKSILPDIYGSILNLYNSPNFNLHDSNQKFIDNLLKNSIHNFYSEVDCKYLIDRNGAWGTPFNLENIKKYITEDIKIIFPVRNIVDILSSFVISLEEYPENFICEEMYNEVYPYNEKRDMICDYLMKPKSSIIDIQLYSLKNLLKTQNKKYLHIIEYEDLVRSPQKEIEKIYKFLDIPLYNHNFKNLNQYEFDGKRYNDFESLGVPLHTIRENIKKTSKNPKKVLSKYAYQKYSNMEFWR